MHFERLSIVLIAVGAISLSMPGDAKAQSLALKRVMLSTGGVGYFEHVAVVDGDATLDLEVRLDQVDDVLKSIVVYDDAGGVGTVSLPSREPLEQAFRDLPFDRGALSSPVTLLNALMGAEIESVGARTLHGRLIGVASENVRLPDSAGTTTRHRISVMTEQGIQHLVFEQAESVRFANPALRAQIERALRAISEHRVRDRRTLKVTVRGAGRRTVRLGYVVATPLWKTSYRLTLPEGGGRPKGALHGWAVVENTSGRDWQGVELTLLSGNPVTFRQALYASYYVDRPTVPVEVLGRMLPRPDAGGVAGGRLAERQRRELELRKTRLERGRDDRFAAEEKVASAPSSMMSNEVPAEPKQLAAPVRAAVSREAATQVVFRVPGAVDVPTGRSVMIPIVSRAIPAVRVSLYQPETHAAYPLAAVRLTNDTGSGLPPGVMTLYQRNDASGTAAYVGDAQLRTLPRGEHRLVSFALDQKTRIDREAKTQQTFAKASINRGVFRQTFTERRVTTYRIKAPAGEDRVVLIEHPRWTGWSVAQPGNDDVEMTADKYRIEAKIAQGSQRTFDVVLERPKLEALSIASLSSSQIGAFARAPEQSQAVRAAFARMSELRQTIERHRAEVAKLEGEQKQIFADQNRIRGNINRVPRGSDLHQRYMTKLNRQEDRLETLNDALVAARTRLQSATDAFSDYVAKLEV